MGLKLLVGLAATVVAGMVVSKMNETAGGFVFLLGLVLSLVWAATK